MHSRAGSPGYFCKGTQKTVQSAPLQCAVSSSFCFLGHSLLLRPKLHPDLLCKVKPTLGTRHITVHVLLYFYTAKKEEHW